MVNTQQAFRQATSTLIYKKTIWCYHLIVMCNFCHRTVLCEFPHTALHGEKQYFQQLLLCRKKHEQIIDWYSLVMI